MAKYKVVYDIGGRRVELTKYVTTDIIENPHETRGRTKNVLGVARMYIRQGKLVIRKPNVLRRSKKVIEVNQTLEKLRGSLHHPAVQCAGQPWDKFKKCLSENMKLALKNANYKKEEEQTINASDWLTKF